MGDIITSLKEFIWDVIGFLIPGYICILVLNLVLLKSIEIENSFLIDWNLLGINYLIVVVAYGVGFILYSLTQIKQNVQDVVNKWISNLKILNSENKKSQKARKFFEQRISYFWESEFEKSALFAEAIKYLEKEGFEKASSMKIREMRNILMSRSPELDQKIYTFMFRSDFFGHIETILLIVFFLFGAQLILTCFDVYFLKFDDQFLVFYLLCLLLSIPIGDSRRSFYSKAMRIPFSNIKKQ